MKIAIYYIAILIIAAVLLLAADRAKRKGKNLIEYLCYLGIFVEVLILI